MQDGHKAFSAYHSIGLASGLSITGSNVTGA